MLRYAFLSYFLFITIYIIIDDAAKHAFQALSHYIILLSFSHFQANNPGIIQIME